LSSLFLAALMLVAGACEQGANQAHDEDSAGVAATADSTTRVAGAAADEHKAPGHGAEGHTVASEGGQALLPIMQRLGSEMTALTYALMTDDYEGVTRSAAAIAAHAPISADELERIKTELGPGMATFEAVDESVHVASTRLHDAAQARSLGVVVERLAEVQRGCVSCHVQFREKLRTNRSGR
ncbi:MAG TPA: hypothetical protein VFZ21_26175, partial [Gemmatimonadaceae bacterium]|nr:hypothetical protein [Gemmatimonadaceae bacterium]